MSDLGECDYQDGNPAVWEFIEGGASLFLCVEHVLAGYNSTQAELHTLSQQVEKAREGLSATKAKVLTPTDAETVLAWIEPIARDTLDQLNEEEKT